MAAVAVASAARCLALQAQVVAGSGGRRCCSWRSRAPLLSALEAPAAPLAALPSLPRLVGGARSAACGSARVSLPVVAVASAERLRCGADSAVRRVGCDARLGGNLSLAATACGQQLRASALTPPRRGMATRAQEQRLSPDAARALGNIKEKVKKTRVTLTRAQRRNFQGNIRKYQMMGGREEFHNVDRNRHGRIFEPWHNFEVVITSSKNNCWIAVRNKGWKYRCVFTSWAGNVGYRKAMKKTESATQRIALNVARKLKRLGVVCCEVTFRKIMKVEVCLEAFRSVGLVVTKLTHQPRLPKGDPSKPRKQRRV
eukprot:TRINITY_DN22296_c0_g4_i1.p1 TRINITY_DN22296_c0_g4~~TRINITY_DN22296_c0_g4_i1.p1  ORF type:complete len:338 (+),score=67.93 TRINITY_DN22296_c0_g4_i1:73-1014(+)